MALQLGGRSGAGSALNHTIRARRMHPSHAGLPAGASGGAVWRNRKWRNNWRVSSRVDAPRRTTLGRQALRPVTHGRNRHDASDTAILAAHGTLTTPRLHLTPGTPNHWILRRPCLHTTNVFAPWPRPRIPDPGAVPLHPPMPTSSLQPGSFGILAGHGPSGPGSRRELVFLARLLARKPIPVVSSEPPL